MAGGARLVVGKVSRRLFDLRRHAVPGYIVQQSGSAAYHADVIVILLTPETSAANRRVHSRNYRRCVEGRFEFDVSGFGTTPS